MRIDYNIQDRFDFSIFLPVLGLMIIGLVAIYSATYNHPTAGGNFEKQLFWTFISLSAILIIYFLPPHLFRLLSMPGYIASIFFLILVLLVGKKVYGAQSWLPIGAFGFQPSEIGKIGVILFLAKFIDNRQRDINSVKDLSFALLISVVPIMLILMQPDMGTAIVYVFITLSVIYWSGISLFSLFVVLSPGLITFASIFGTYTFLAALLMILVGLIAFKRNLFTSASIFVANVAAGFFFDFAFNLLKPHQQKRIESFIDPSADPLGSGYNALQAKVAIGSGGLVGKGFLEGNQTQLRFIPEQWTDFIFCVIGEEFGFIGSILTIILFMILFLRLLNLTQYTKNLFSSVVLIGILSYFFIHFSINVGMNIGVAPVIGVPLPFVSYGGTSLLVNSIMIGIVLNIYRNRKYHT